MEITCYVPVLKSYKPVTEVVSAKLQQAITLKKGTQHVISVHIQKEQVLPNNFYVGKYALTPSGSKVRAHGKINPQYQMYVKKSLQDPTLKWQN